MHCVSSWSGQGSSSWAACQEPPPPRAEPYCDEDSAGDFCLPQMGPGWEPERSPLPLRPWGPTWRQQPRLGRVSLMLSVPGQRQAVSTGGSAREPQQELLERDGAKEGAHTLHTHRRGTGQSHSVHTGLGTGSWYPGAHEFSWQDEYAAPTCSQSLGVCRQTGPVVFAASPLLGEVGLSICTPWVSPVPAWLQMTKPGPLTAVPAWPILPRRPQPLPLQVSLDSLLCEPQGLCTHCSCFCFCTCL